METWKDDIQGYLPGVEEFLTSVLLEETKIEIVSDELIGREEALESTLEDDIFLLSRDRNSGVDFLLVLDKEWYGLLSSIMLGVEEKSNNEITRDLLYKFSSEFSTTLRKILSDNGVETDPADIQLLTEYQAADELMHEQYLRLKLEVEGLADNRVRAELLLGNPEAQRNSVAEQTAETDPAPSDEGQESAGDEEDREEAFEETPPEEITGQNGGEEAEVITARQVEFEEFSEDPAGQVNGDSERSLDLLKDVEMDVSVELGRIELPLGKVLQLSKGSVIELERLAGEPVDILVNGHRIAYGEVVVIDEHFGVRISNLITTRQRLAQLK